MECVTDTHYEFQDRKKVEENMLVLIVTRPPLDNFGNKFLVVVTE